MAKNSMFGMAGIGIAAAIGFVFVLASIGNTAINTPPFVPGQEIFENVTDDGPIVLASQQLKKFASLSEMTDFLQKSELEREKLSTAQSSGDVFFGSGRETLNFDAVEESQSAPQVLSQEGLEKSADFDYSTTNVQVKNVDEPDFLKNDGKYAYILSGDKLTIVDAYPAENATIVAKVALDIQEGQSLQNMFLNKDRLVIFYQEYSEEFIIQEYDFEPQPISSPRTHAMVIDISERENPKVLQDYEVSGYYNNARMIANHVYLITISDLYSYDRPILPTIKESSTTIVVPDVYYFDNPELYYSFNTVTSIDLFADGDDAVNSNTYMMGSAGTIYMSEENLYITYQKNMPYYYYETNSRDRFFDVVVPLLPKDVQEEIKSIETDPSLNPSEKWERVSDLLQETYNERLTEAEKNKLFEEIREGLADYDSRINKDTQKTVIHRIGIGNGTLDYATKGEVPGRLLNQFSMDENGDRFRIATTSEFYSQYRTFLHNNVYVLNEDLKIVGSLEEIAPDESIYSARFMGDRLYLVTFQQIDPFFVIDLSEDDPKILGELKLPGYSNYLHPYDDDNIIGIGRETKEAEWGGIETLGVKLALFDVSDVEDPEVVDVFEIGERGADSEVLWDHKALLFDKNKNVLSIPISITEYPEYDGERYVEPKSWRGFYVFGIDPSDGFDLKGKVLHSEDNYYYMQGSRSFYIGDVLYTVTLDNLMKMNDIEDLDKINEIEIGSTGGIIRYPID